jgi:ornithine cyclodeaminase/alanine dehydrogenase-like protein (mu-crystallin family)
MKLYLSEEDVRACLTMPKAIELLDIAFRQLADGTAINHPRRRVILPTGSVLHYMAAGTPEYFGLKAYSANPKTGAHFEVLLYRSGDAMPLATIAANHLGQIRTGAATGLATKYLARPDASIAGIIGSGFQAETQLAAIAKVRDLREVRVWSRKPERREEFAHSCAEKFELNVRAAGTARECVDGADIVVTATSSKEPVLAGEWISPGTHINAAGSNWATRRELPTDLILDLHALVAVDSVEVGKIESGDLLIPLQERSASAVPAPRFPAIEIADIIAGKEPGRTAAGQITIFKSNGLALEDIAVAGYVYGEALQRGIGQRH